jgi:hypothetical protein
MAFFTPIILTLTWVHLSPIPFLASQPIVLSLMRMLLCIGLLGGKCGQAVFLYNNEPTRGQANVSEVLLRSWRECQSQ